jgi:ribosomal protein S6E (S10)
MEHETLLHTLPVRKKYSDDAKGRQQESEDNKRVFAFLGKAVAEHINEDKHLQKDIKDLVDKKKFLIPLMQTEAKLENGIGLGKEFESYEFSLKIILGNAQTLAPMHKDTLVQLKDLDIAIVVAVDTSCGTYRDKSKGVGGKEYDFPFKFNALPEGDINDIHDFFFGDEASTNIVLCVNFNPFRF